jgi:hypothetical protein
VTTERTLQAKLFDPAAPVLGDASIASVTAPFGKVHGMLLSMGRGLTSAFVYTDALPEDVVSARLRYRQGSQDWKIVEDEIFPFEFSIWMDEAAGDFEGMIEIETTRLEKQESPLIVLRYDETRGHAVGCPNGRPAGFILRRAGRELDVAHGPGHWPALVRPAAGTRDRVARPHEKISLKRN